MPESSVRTGRRWKLRNSLLFTMSILAVVPLLAAGGSAAFLARKALIDSAAAGLETTARSKAVALERWLADKISDTGVLAQSELMSEGRPETIRHSLQLARRQQDEFEAIVVVDTHGNRLAQDGEVGPELLRVVKAGTRAARLQAPSPDGQVRLLVAVPLREDLGWLAATINFTPILTELSEIRPGETSRTYMEEGTSAANFVAPHVEDEKGRRVLVCRRALPRFDQVVVVTTELDEILSPLGPMLYVLVALTVLGVAMSVSAAMLLTSRLRRPILELDQAARDVAAERFDRRLGVETEDELGSLARSFNEMTEKLELARTSLSERFRSALDRAETADRKLAAQERELARAARLTALGTMSAGLAHEIRTPLAALQVFVQSFDAPLDESRREDLEFARGELDRLARLVERFLDFARPAPPELARVDLNALLDDTLRLLEPKLKAGNVRVVQQRDPAVSEIQGDRDQFKQVLVNLVLNAIQAMPHGGTLRIASEHLRDASGSAFAVRVLISDTGQGIPPEDLERIFDPFFTTKPEGVGLGLSISHAIVEKHGGRLAVESRVGLGTQFAVELPISGRGAGA